MSTSHRTPGPVVEDVQVVMNAPDTSAVPPWLRLVLYVIAAVAAPVGGWLSMQAVEPWGLALSAFAGATSVLAASHVPSGGGLANGSLVSDVPAQGGATRA